MKDGIVNLTKEEREFIHIQVGYRKYFFMEELEKAAKNQNERRIKECTNAIDKINSICNKMLGV